MVNTSHIREALLAAGDQPVVEFDFAHSLAGSGQLIRWRDLENVRARRDGIREDMFIRGGSEQEVELSSNIIQKQSFTTSWDGQSKRYLCIKDQAGSIILYDLDAESSTTLFNSVFAGTHRVFIHVVGRFLYVFDPVTPAYRYADLKTNDTFTWLDLEEPVINSLSAISDGDFEGNIWGFQKGESVICLYQQLATLTASYSQTSFLFNGEDKPGRWYKYTYNAGKYLTINGQNLTSTQDFYLDGTETVTEGGSGDNAQVKVYFIPKQNFELDYSAVLGRISDVSELDSSSSPLTGRTGAIDFSGVEPNAITVNTGYEFPYDTDVLVRSDIMLILPDNVDIRGLVGVNGKYVLRKSSITENPTYEHPVLYKAYTAIFEMNDGSFTLPGPSQYISISADDMFNTEYKLIKQGVEVTLDNSNVPEGAVKLHLFASRWALSPNDCYLPNEKYPNGTFWLAGTYEADVDTIEDYTSDRQLIDPLSSYIPLSSGISDQFGKGQIQPLTATSFKSGVLFCGYTINRYSTGQYFRFVGSGSTVANREITVIVEFSDGTRSSPETFTAKDTSQLDFFGVNALVSAFHVYLVNTSGSPNQGYYVERVDRSSPYFYGRRLVISTDTADHESLGDFTPSSDDSFENVHLNNFLAQAFPPQRLTIDAQVEVEGVQEIKRLYLVGVDQERGSSIRHRFVAFGDHDTVSGFLTLSDDAGRLLFEVDTQSIDRPLILKADNAALLFGDGVIFQGADGIYLLRDRQTTKLVDRGRFSILDNDVLDIAYHGSKDEIHFLSTGNKVLVLPLQGERPIETEPFIFSYPTGTRTARTITSISDDLFIGFDRRVIKADISDKFTDDDINASAASITGLLTSDYIRFNGGDAGKVTRQLYMDCIELNGLGYQAIVRVDDQESRFDDAADDDWTDAFVTAKTISQFTLTMRGDIKDIWLRSIDPRIQVELQSTAAGRLSSIRLYATPLEHLGASRN